MKKILVPCDFSKPAINAYRFALDVAQQSKGVVHLLHIIELPVMHDTVLMPVLNFEEQLLKDLGKSAEERFKKLIAKYKAVGIKVVTSVKFGAVWRMIHDYIDDEKIDLVLMGTHGASGLREIFIGSNAERMVRTSPVPVLVIKDYAKEPIKHIVFPNILDLEDQEDLVMKVKALQHFFKAHLHIVWINTPLNFTPDTWTNERLQAFAKRFMLKNYSTHIFNSKEEKQGILEFTTQIKGDLIAIGTHGRKGIAHVMSGSLAEDVINHGKCLVWTYLLKNEPVEA